MAPSSPCVAFVTYEQATGIHPDDRLAADVLRADGIRVEAIPWSVPEVRWEQYDGVVLRSCWDYHRKPGLFLQWIARLEEAGARLWNPPALVRWNADKRYLMQLGSKGIPIIPTVALHSDAPERLAELFEREGWSRAVVKPAISASGYQTWVTSERDAVTDEPRFRRLLADGGVMVQKFVPEVQDQGEWSCIFFRDGFSHAVLKRPAAGDFRTQQEFGGTPVLSQPSPELVRQAQRVTDTLTTPWLYARVDGCVVGGELQLMELEVIEPSLFLRYHPEAPRRFAEAIRSVIESP
jgi:glutathione synthase/RimK-type ligase-like ATP-grasp enzyme